MDFNDWLKQKNIAEGEPVAIGVEKRPYTDFNSFLESKDKQPKVEPETIKAAAKIQAETPQQPPVDTQRFLQGAGAGGEIPQGTQGEPTAPLEPTPEPFATKGTSLEAPRLDQEALLAAQQFSRDDLIPTIGAMAATGAALAVTAPVSIPAMLAIGSISAFVGGATGEAAEQVLKEKGVIERAPTEAPIKDSYDLASRSVIRGAEEALWQFIPDVIGVAGKKIASKFTTTEVAKQTFIKQANEYALRKGEDEGLLTLGDVVDVGVLDMLEAVASNSFVAGKKLKNKRVAQEAMLSTLKEEAITDIQAPAKAFAGDSTDEAITTFLDANYDEMNSIAEAAIVNIGFRKTQEAQKAVAGAKYKAMGSLMEPQYTVRRQEVIDTGLLDSKGNPLRVVRDVEKVSIKFPVDMRPTRKIADDKYEKLATVIQEKSIKLDPELVELRGALNKTSFSGAVDYLQNMRLKKRSLEAGGGENAKNRIRILGEAIDTLQGSMELSMKKASDAGIQGPDGESLETLWQEANTLWREQTGRFENKFIKGLLKKTDENNGTATKFAQTMLSDEAYMNKVVNILEAEKKGKQLIEKLPELQATRSAVAGALVKEIFSPYDGFKGKYGIPDYDLLNKYGPQLEKIVGKDELKNLNEIADSMAYVTGESRQTLLAFAQTARESGSFVQVIQGAMTGSAMTSVKGAFAVMAIPFMSNKLLTSPTVLKYMADLGNNNLPEFHKRQLRQFILHQIENADDANTVAQSPEMQAKQERNSREYQEYLRQQAVK
jgi:hypothetical protein